MFSSIPRPLALLALGAVLLSKPAIAAPALDMGTTTCQDWIDASDDEQDLMIAWLRGYASGRNSAALYNPANARIDRAAFMAYCRQNVTIGLLSAGAKLPK